MASYTVSGDITPNATGGYLEQSGELNGKAWYRTVNSAYVLFWYPGSGRWRIQDYEEDTAVWQSETTSIVGDYLPLFYATGTATVLEGDPIMATPTKPSNQARTLKRIIATLQVVAAGQEADKPVGGKNMGRLRHHVWVCAGTPSGTAPTGMVAGDLILDTTYDLVYRYITGTTYVNATATS